MNEKSRDNSSRPIKEILSEILNQPVIMKGIGESQAIKAWEAVLGPSIMRTTTNVYIKSGILFASLNSSVIRSELLLNKEKIIRSLNDYVGYNVVNDIVLR